MCYLSEFTNHESLVSAIENYVHFTITIFADTGDALIILRRMSIASPQLHNEKNLPAAQHGSFGLSKNAGRARAQTGVFVSKSIIHYLHDFVKFIVHHITY